jgi:hypothetical protein
MFFESSNNYYMTDAAVALSSAVLKRELSPEEIKAHTRARRTSFVQRFIVLREGKRSKAHRFIEMMEWEDQTTAEELYDRFRKAFLDNKDSMTPVDRDLKRALAHADRSITFFIREYNSRSTTSFIESLEDYGRSNTLLFGDDEQPRPGGWRMPIELKKIKCSGKN